MNKAQMYFVIFLGIAGTAGFLWGFFSTRGKK